MMMVEQLYELGCKLPPPALAELLDFAQFLRQKEVTPRSRSRCPLLNWRGGLNKGGRLN